MYNIMVSPMAPNDSRLEEFPLDETVSDIAPDFSHQANVQHNCAQTITCFAGFFTLIIFSPAGGGVLA